MDTLYDHAEEQPTAEEIEKKPIELFRCMKCGKSIRTMEEIRKGKITYCKKCGSLHVIPAWPRRWETIKLFFRTGIIFIAEPLKEGNKNELPIRKY